MNTGLLSNGRPKAEDAEALWRAWRDHGDTRARDRLILSYAPMVKYLACRKMRELPSHVELDDLVSAGLIALIGAVDRFDPDKGATFEQYAWRRVSGALLDELRGQDWAPRRLRRSGRAIAQARDELQSRKGRLPSELELACKLEQGVAELRRELEDLSRAEVLSLSKATQGLDHPQSVELGETLEAPPGSHDPEVVTLARERLAVVRQAISGLSQREQQILMANIENVPGLDIARAFGITESRVSQIMTSIRRKLSQHDSLYNANAVNHRLNGGRGPGVDTELTPSGRETTARRHVATSAARSNGCPREFVGRATLELAGIAISIRVTLHLRSAAGAETWDGHFTTEDRVGAAALATWQTKTAEPVRLRIARKHDPAKAIVRMVTPNDGTLEGIGSPPQRLAAARR
jgi:RNA polymerase sigma factor FliA